MPDAQFPAILLSAILFVPAAVLSVFVRARAA